MPALLDCIQQTGYADAKRSSCGSREEENFLHRLHTSGS